MSTEGKKNIANSQENTITLLYSEKGCLKGVDDYIAKQTSDCEDGVKQEYQSNSNSFSVVFTPCIEIRWMILVIVSVIMVFFSPLKCEIFTIVCFIHYIMGFFIFSDDLSLEFEWRSDDWF